MCCAGLERILGFLASTQPRVMSVSNRTILANAEMRSLEDLPLFDHLALDSDKLSAVRGIINTWPPPTPNPRLRCRLPNRATHRCANTIELSWLFPWQELHHLPRTASWLIPRQTDCPGSFLSAQPMRTLLPSFSLEALHLITVKFLPNHRSHFSIRAISGWNPHAFSCQGTD
jgi:hypothetical protein